MPATELQRKMFGRWGKGRHAAFEFGERADMLREWYRKGQHTFRLIKHHRLIKLNDLLQHLSDIQRMGFLMGWNSDDYARRNELPLSHEGLTHAEEL